MIYLQHPSHALWESVNGFQGVFPNSVSVYGATRMAIDLNSDACFSFSHPATSLRRFDEAIKQIAVVEHSSRYKFDQIMLSSLTELRDWPDSYFVLPHFYFIFLCQTVFTCCVYIHAIRLHNVFVVSKHISTAIDCQLPNGVMINVIKYLFVLTHSS